MQSVPQATVTPALRVALISAGKRGADWMPALTGAGAAGMGMVLTAVCDLDAASAGSTWQGSALADVRHVANLAALLALMPDIIVDATTPLARLAMTRTAMRVGRHVLCDPPLAPDEATALALVGAAGRVPGLFAVAYQARHRPGLRQLRALVASGAMGRPVVLRAVLPAVDTLVLQNLMRGPAVEACDAARAILGCDAVAVRCFGPPVKARFDMADDATFELALGEGGECWHLQLQAGTAICEGTALARMAEGGGILPAPEAQPDGLAGALHDLVKAIRLGGKPAVGPRGAAASLAMVLAARASMAHGGRTQSVMPLGLMSDASQSPAARAPRPAPTLTPTGEVS